MSLFKSLTSLISKNENTTDESQLQQQLDEVKGKEDNGHPPVGIDQIPPSDVLVTDCCDCDKDCLEHQKYPPLNFDTETRLLGSMLPYGRHVMIATAQSDWPARIEEDYGTLAANLQALLANNPMPWRTFVTNTSQIPSHGSEVHCGLDVTILPDNIILGDVTPDDAQLIYDVFCKRPLPATDEVNIEEEFKNVDLKMLKIFPVLYDSMILICSHRKRDKRCGVTAPILHREFDHVLRDLDINDGEGGTTVMMVSHIGGHKYAGNVITYINRGRTGIWYGRVKTCHCREIVEQTILKGKVIKELYRGSMSHSFGDVEKNKKCRLEW
ncbi:Sucrase/ferredoxin-like-domain-containing protein [Mycotypha africana]|uniref:Sucrase/ferredoxin-like-domain-containing protein n=1 Tax=Mycotypha africana TaxID=64632 RepID=UPI00230026CB|nr:Sucrase/ferredoxin-like-domain-containing protein [Mycotypha africana]KAI8984479.1 Sucrase/ferredoxin-like-domain-containing protein [Mycotypha africana]